METLNNELSKVNWSPLYNLNEPNEATNLFLELFLSCYDKVLPLKNVKQKNNKPWFSKGILRSCSQLKSLHYLRSIADLNTKYTYRGKTYNLILFYKNYRNTYNKLILNAKKIHNTRKIANSDNKIKTAWQVVKGELGVGREGQECMRVKRGGVDVCESEIADEFGEAFASVTEKLGVIDEGG